MKFIEIFGAGLAGGLFTLAILKFLGERLLTQILNKEFEKYKNELNARTEALKARLSIFAHEQNVVTSRVDVQKADAIHHVYSAIRNVTNPSSRICAGYPVVNGNINDEINYYFELAEAAHEAGKVLADSLSDHAIYFTGSAYEKIANVATDTMKYNALFLKKIRKGIAESVSNSLLIEEIRREQEQYSLEYSKGVNWKVGEIVDLFRGELGIQKI